MHTHRQADRLTMFSKFLRGRLCDVVDFFLGVMHLFGDILHVDHGAGQTDVKVETGAVEDHNLVSLSGGL